MAGRITSATSTSLAVTTPARSTAGTVAVTLAYGTASTVSAGSSSYVSTTATTSNATTTTTTTVTVKPGKRK